jgi:hypothetical protein
MEGSGKRAPTAMPNRPRERPVYAYAREAAKQAT